MAEVKPKVQPVSAFALFTKSYELVKANPNIFILLYSVPGLFALWNFLNWFTYDKTTWTDERLSFTNWFGSFSGLQLNTPAGIGVGIALVLAVVAVFFSLMQVILTLRISQGKTLKFLNVWEEFKQKGFKLLLLEIVMGVFIFVGFLLLIVPGVILLWRLFLAPYILLDKNTGVDETLRRSWNMTRGYGWPIYAVILLAILLSISGVVPYFGPIISFLLLVAYSCAPALRYLELK